MNRQSPVRRHFIQVSLGMGLLSGASAANPSLHWDERAFHGFGTTLWLRAAHSDLRRLEQALDETVKVIRQIEAQMNLFDSNSALVQLNTHGYLHQANSHLLAILQLAQTISQLSHGAFDITVQSLWRLWQEQTRLGRLPSDVQLP
jgi:FAD:protein FMN transferase